MSTAVPEVDIRRSIKSHVERTETAHRTDVIESVAQYTGAGENAVESELDRMEKHGFAYLVNGEIRIP